MMRKYLFLGLFLAVAFQVSGQQTLTSLSGKIENFANNKVKLLYRPIPFADNVLNMERGTDENGYFNLKFPIPSATPIDLSIDNATLTFSFFPGDSIFIFLNPQDSGVDKVQFFGRGHETTLMRYHWFQRFDNVFLTEFNEIVENRNPQEFEAFAKLWEKEFDRVHEAILKEYQISKEAALSLKKIANLKKVNWYLVYANIQLRKNKINYTDLPIAFQKAVKNKEFLTYDLAHDPEYQNYLLLHLNTTSMISGSENCALYSRYLRFVDSVYLPQSKDYLMARILSEAYDNKCEAEVDEVAKAFIAKTKNALFAQHIDEKREKINVGGLAKGSPAPDFDFVDAMGNKHRLADLKGKVIYLDFWATWCRPCLMAMASAKPLKERFEKDTSIAFVYISTDQDANKWKNHYITNNGEKYQWHMGPSLMEASMAYQIQYIPRYVIIDKNGRIVNANAPRPDDPSLPELLIKLSQQTN